MSSERSASGLRVVTARFGGGANEAVPDLRHVAVPEPGPADDTRAVAGAAVAVSPRLGAGSLLALAGGGLALAAIAGVVVSRSSPRSRPARAARLAGCGAALLAGSVLADSAMEHYRGSFKKPAMFVAPPAAAVTLSTAVATVLSSRFAAVKSAVFGAAIATGLFGTGFHIMNIVRRPGGLSFNNLFYRAPFGAPGALALAGAAGVGAVAAQRATRLASGRHGSAERSAFAGERPLFFRERPVPARERLALNDPRRRAGRRLGVLTAAGLFGLTAEVGLLHFRGAFHNKLMYLPVAGVPLTGAALLAASFGPGPGRLATARRALQTTAVLGLLGSGLHAYGVSRNMGGWANWTQNLFSGPPVAAPPSLAGIALMGFAALDLLRPQRPASLDD